MYPRDCCKNADENSPMISANEARRITDAASFEKSWFVALINSNIHDAASEGKDAVTMLIPQRVADQTVQFLEKHGFRVIMKEGITGVVVTAAW